MKQLLSGIRYDIELQKQIFDITQESWALRLINLKKSTRIMLTLNFDEFANIKAAKNFQNSTFNCKS